MSVYDVTELACGIGSLPDDIVELTFAAEAVGNSNDSSAVRAVLIPLLSHPNPVVREGAIDDLARHLDDKVRALLNEMVEHDPSLVIRVIALETLSD